MEVSTYQRLMCSCSYDGRSNGRDAIEGCNKKYNDEHDAPTEYNPECIDIVDIFDNKKYVFAGCGSHKYFAERTFGQWGGYEFKLCYTVGGVQCTSDVDLKTEWSVTAKNWGTRWRQDCTGDMDCNARPRRVTDGTYLASVIIPDFDEDRLFNDWTTCCKKCRLSDGCKEWDMNLDTNECRLWSEVFSTEDLTEEISLAQPSDTSMIYFHGTVGFNDAPINCDFAGRKYGTCKGEKIMAYAGGERGIYEMTVIGIQLLTIGQVMALFTIMVLAYRRRNIIEVESYDYLVLPDTQGTREVGGGKGQPSRTESYTIHHAEVKYVLDSSNNNSAQAYETLHVKREGSPYSPGSPITVFARKDTKQAYGHYCEVDPLLGCCPFILPVSIIIFVTGAGILCVQTIRVNFYSGGKFLLEHEYFMHKMSADYDDVSGTWIFMFIWCIITFVIVAVGFYYILKKSMCGFIKALRSNEKIVVPRNPDASVRLPAVPDITGTYNGPEGYAYIVTAGATTAVVGVRILLRGRDISQHGPREMHYQGGMTWEGVLPPGVHRGAKLYWTFDAPGFQAFTSTAHTKPPRRFVKHVAPLASQHMARGLGPVDATVHSTTAVEERLVVKEPAERGEQPGTALGGGGGSNLADKLRELQTARERDILTESEFQAARQNAIASLTDGSSDVAPVMSQQPTTGPAKQTEPGAAQWWHFERGSDFCGGDASSDACSSLKPKTDEEVKLNTDYFPEAWYIKDDIPAGKEQMMEQRLEPNVPASQEVLTDLGIAYWKLDAGAFEYPVKSIPWDPSDAVDPQLVKIRDDRGYSYADIITVHPDHLPGFDEKIKAFFTEHIHDAEEIRYILGGSGYFDVRDKQDKWIRIHIKAGDLMTLPEGIYHRFTCDSTEYIHAMRLFKGVPVWTPINRPCEEHESRVSFVKKFLAPEITVYPS